MILFTIFLEFSKHDLSNKIRVMEPAFVSWIVRSNSTRFSLFAVPGSLNFSIDKLVTDEYARVNSSSCAVMFTKYTQWTNVWKRERGEIHNDKFGNPLAVEFLNMAWSFHVLTVLTFQSVLGKYRYFSLFRRKAIIFFFYMYL